MKKKAIAKPTKGRKPALAKTRVVPRAEDAFAEVVTLIQLARHRALRAVNTEIVGLYWQVGEHISRKLASAEWATGWWTGWLATWPARSPACAASPGRTSSGCGRSMKPIGASKSLRP